MVQLHQPCWIWSLCWNDDFHCKTKVLEKKSTVAQIIGIELSTPKEKSVINCLSCGLVFIYGCGTTLILLLRYDTKLWTLRCFLKYQLLRYVAGDVSVRYQSQKYAAWGGVHVETLSVLVGFSYVKIKVGNTWLLSSGIISIGDPWY
jgi:drug/metabolite transporter superfamily protein YnfA